MTSDTFKRLKNEMFNCNVTYDFLSRDNKLKKHSIGYFTQRFNAKFPWTLDEIYYFCDLLHIDPVLIPIFFPKGGKDLSEKQVNQYLQKIVIENPPISLQRMQITVMSDDVQFKKCGE